MKKKQEMDNNNSDEDITNEEDDEQVLKDRCNSQNGDDEFSSDEEIGYDAENELEDAKSNSSTSAHYESFEAHQSYSTDSLFQNIIGNFMTYVLNVRHYFLHNVLNNSSNENRNIQMKNNNGKRPSFVVLSFILILLFLFFFSVQKFVYGTMLKQKKVDLAKKNMMISSGYQKPIMPNSMHMHTMITRKNDELFFFNIHHIKHLQHQLKSHPHQNGIQYPFQSNAKFQQKQQHLAPLSAVNYPVGGPVIATLVTNTTKDVEDLQSAIRSLVFLKGDDLSHPAPILVFNEGNLSPVQVQLLVTAASSVSEDNNMLYLPRPIAFPIVNFEEFPSKFPKEEIAANNPQFKVKNRKPWGYYQMIRFWVSRIWLHPALEQFETVMRIDSDSCFKSINKHLPNFAFDHLVYHSQFVGYEAEGDTFVKNLYSFVHTYVSENGIRIKNPLLWQFISTTWETQNTLPLYNTNFELSSKTFMQRKDVMDFHIALTEMEPFGVYRYRWGDAVTRMFTAALFAQDELLMQSAPEGYYHKDKCKHEDVKNAISSLQFMYSSGGKNN